MRDNTNTERPCVTGSHFVFLPWANVTATTSQTPLIGRLNVHGHRRTKDTWGGDEDEWKERGRNRGGRGRIEIRGGVKGRREEREDDRKGDRGEIKRNRRDERRQTRGELKGEIGGEKKEEEMSWNWNWVEGQLWVTGRHVVGGGERGEEESHFLSSAKELTG